MICKKMIELITDEGKYKRLKTDLLNDKDPERRNVLFVMTRRVNIDALREKLVKEFWEPLFNDVDVVACLVDTPYREDSLLKDKILGKFDKILFPMWIRKQEENRSLPDE